MRTSTRMFLAAIVILSGGALCFAEQVDNPQYVSWSKFKPGTSVTTKVQSDMGGQKTEVETVTTLADLTPEKAVLERKSTMTVAGNTMEMPAAKTEVPAKIEKPVVPPGAAPAGDAPKVDVKESTEEVDVAGTKYKCKVIESKSETMQSKTWTSAEVPGQLVKSETTMGGQMKGTATTAITALTIK